MAAESSDVNIEALAAQLHVDPTSSDFAKELDASDRLSRFRREFVIPVKGELPISDGSDPHSECIYLGGDSIGLQPRRYASAMTQFISHWARYGVLGHRHGFPMWEASDIETAAIVAKLVGASEEEVDVMNTPTINLHLLLLSFFRPTSDRYKILCEDNAFPSDFYTFESQSQLHGLDPASVLMCLKPREGEWCLRTEDIVRVIEAEGAEIAVICLPGVQFRTGQLFDIPTITRAGHRAGCSVGWDLSHAIGNVELRLHEWDVDFAVWCHYKYVCSGPGSSGGAFMHSRHANTKPPTLYGWWGHEYDSRFDMDNRMRLISGVKGYQMSCPAVANLVGVRVGAELLLEAGIGALREKSKLLTAYLEFRLQRCDAAFKFHIITPNDPEQRGAQLSVRFPHDGESVYEKLGKRGVVCDLRRPDVLRFAPLPIYNSFGDIDRLVATLEDLLK